VIKLLTSHLICTLNLICVLILVCVIFRGGGWWKQNKKGHILSSNCVFRACSGEVRPATTVRPLRPATTVRPVGPAITVPRSGLLQQLFGCVQEFSLVWITKAFNLEQLFG
jgi:hypothetical protein